ncbi:unnamed protein product [Caenorhabditis auriculariae]|uniref:Uncharacterized protein n=1 Tax=Caenorhabditis auriculariae TaxID=2777116 RepID=A0A8S1H3Q5_9PELO|nr:unnamed protein product [Caenorhabditis auriculariae]
MTDEPTSTFQNLQLLFMDVLELTGCSAELEMTEKYDSFWNPESLGYEKASAVPSRAQYTAVWRASTHCLNLRGTMFAVLRCYCNALKYVSFLA